MAETLVARLGDHVDVRVDAAVASIGISYFKNLRRMAGLINQVITK